MSEQGRGAMRWQWSNYCVSGCRLLSLSLCRRGFEDLLKISPFSLFMLCGCISSPLSSLMGRSMYWHEWRTNCGHVTLVTCAIDVGGFRLCSAAASMWYLLSYSMVQGPSWQANRFAASQEIPRISRNPKVHYRTHKRPPPVSILGQPNPVHIPTSHLLEIHPNIIHPSMRRSPQRSPSLRFPHHDPIHPPLLTHTCHMSNPSHSSRFYHPHYIGWRVQII